MQRIANPLKQRGMERIEMQRIANPLKQCGMELAGMQRIANPLKLQEMKEKPFADYPFYILLMQINIASTYSQ